MSRRSSRSNSSGQKRKRSNEENAIAASEPEDQEVKAPRTGEEVKEDKKEPETSETQDNDVKVQENTKKSNDISTVSFKYIEAKRRALLARRKLDASVRQRQHVASIKKYMTHLEKEFCGHLREVEKQLRLCQQSNKILAKELQVIKDAIIPRESVKKSCTPGRRPKAPRPQNTVVSIPKDPSEANEHLGEVLIMDPKSDLEVLKMSSDGNFTVIVLNREEDYPQGSWLGDERNPQMRVRCEISPEDMIHTMSMNKSAEKLALKLLDLLFDKETQATSNLSGTGKHKKKKLDPLLIYGIHCHLVKHYKISNEDWYRIRQNIDSKCRTAFRRKQKGLDLYPRQSKKPRRTFVSSDGTTFTAQVGEDFQNSEEVQQLQQVVSHLQGLPGITIIQEQTEGNGEVEGSSPTIVGHTVLHHQGGEIHPNQLREVHLSTGQTIAISQSGELEIREVKGE